jgi:hypothetical protein
MHRILGSIKRSKASARDAEAPIWLAADALPPVSGGLLWHIGLPGRYFDLVRIQLFGFCFGLEVSDMRVWTISRLYGDEPTAVFYHGFKIGDRLSHCRNMRR